MGHQHAKGYADRHEGKRLHASGKHPGDTTDGAAPHDVLLCLEDAAGVPGCLMHENTRKIYMIEDIEGRTRGVSVVYNTIIQIGEGYGVMPPPLTPTRILSIHNHVHYTSTYKRNIMAEVTT